ncbi:MAG: hypothetical protein KGL39_52920 [Patescibacteria group bacterium]|nr:hypothetical protein [Patescibacteria group bacterium]
MWEFTGAIASAVLLIVVGVIRSQLARKDESQEKLITDLYTKHEDDSKRLQALELKIAENHYQKLEVDRLLDRFKGYFDERFGRLESLIIKPDRRDHG